MSINKILILLLTILLFQFQISKAEDSNNLEQEELPAIDPFAAELVILVKEVWSQQVKVVKGVVC